MGNDLLQTKHDIITGMLDSWHAALVEQAEDNRNREEDMKKNPTFLEQIVLFELQRAKELGPEGVLITEQRVSALIGFAAGATGNQSQALRIGLPLLPSNVHGIVGAAIGYTNTLVSTRVAILLPIILQQSGASISPNMAKVIGNVVALVQHIYSESFARDIGALVRGGPIQLNSEAQMQKIVASIRITLLVNALGAIYKEETGGMTSIEIGDLIMGKLHAEAGTLQAALAELIYAELAPFSLEARERLMEATLSYMDDNPSSDELLDSATAFNGILGTSTNEQILRQAG
jgi:hypothetical protein